MQSAWHQKKACAVRANIPLALRGRRRTEVAPCGPASRQEQGSRRRGEPAATVGLAAGLELVWEMAEGAPAGPKS